WKAAFRENIAMEELDGDLLEMEIINARWQRLVALHAEEIAVAVPLPSTAAGTCTTGRCDCKACPKKHTCDCQEYQTGWVDCFATQRLNCNVDESPDPRSGAGPVLDTRS